MELPRVVSRETVYKGKLFDIDVTELVMPNGVVARREGLVHPGAVCMVPVTDGGELLMVTQYRHSAGRRLLELPAGTLEKGEAPTAAVARELQEEVGMRPRLIEPMGGFFVAPGYTSEYIHLYVCRELEPGKLDGDEDEDIEVERVKAGQALELIEEGVICDAKSVIGILRWVRRGG